MIPFSLFFVCMVGLFKGPWILRRRHAPVRGIVQYVLQMTWLEQSREEVRLILLEAERAQKRWYDGSIQPKGPNGPTVIVRLTTGKVAVLV